MSKLVSCICPTYGAKYRFMLTQCRGEIILPWEDDDISLPNRIRQSVDMLSGYDYWKPCGAFFDAKGEPLSFCSPGNVFHNASAYTMDIEVEYDKDEANEVDELEAVLEKLRGDLEEEDDDDDQ